MLGTNWSLTGGVLHDGRFLGRSAALLCQTGQLKCLKLCICFDTSGQGAEGVLIQQCQSGGVAQHQDLARHFRICTPGQDQAVFNTHALDGADSHLSSEHELMVTSMHHGSNIKVLRCDRTAQ